MYERFRKEKIVEAKIQRLRNAMGVMDTIVTFQNGAWYARHAGSQVSTWRRFGTRLRAVSFSSDLVRAVHARDRRSRETRETRAEAVSLASSVTSVAICVSRVLLDGLQKKERLLVV